jgi:phosphoribosylanthranilate isomerase
MPVSVKICGVRTLADARIAIAAGADLVGFNIIPSSPRFVGEAEVRTLVRTLRQDDGGSSVEFVGVVAGRTHEEIATLLEDTGLDSVQLHGSEPPELVLALGARCFKAVRIGGVEDVTRARCYPGERLLVDARVPGKLGGTGQLLDWSLVTGLASERKLLLAGGLTKDNVTQAVRRVRPWAVDVASGVESSPGVKDPQLVELFIRNAKSD